MKEECIEIDGKPFIYQQENLTYETISNLTEEDGKQTLLLANELFSQKRIRLYLAYGTLLGAIREKSIIKGDTDIDVYVTDESALYSAIPFLYNNGLKLIRINKGILYSFRANDKSYIDVYILRPLKHSIWSYYCYSLAGNAVPKKFFKDSMEIDFLGAKLHCPAHPEKLLEFWYGKTWRIPQSTRGRCEVLTARIWHKIIIYTKSLIKFVIGWKYWKHLIRKR